MSKGTYGNVEPKNVMLDLVQKAHFAVLVCKITRFHAASYRADSADFPKFGASFNHGTVIAPMHSLYQKETTGMESSKM